MGIIAFLILGLLAGAIAKAIAPGEDPGGIIVTMLIGVAGAVIGGFLAAALFDAHPLDEFFDISTWADRNRRVADPARRVPPDPARQRQPPPRSAPMKLLIIIATLGLATFVVLRRRNPEFAERVDGAVKDARTPPARTSHTTRPPATSPRACATRPRASPDDLSGRRPAGGPSARGSTAREHAERRSHTLQAGPATGAAADGATGRTNRGTPGGFIRTARVT